MVESGEQWEGDDEARRGWGRATKFGQWAGQERATREAGRQAGAAGKLGGEVELVEGAGHLAGGGRGGLSRLALAWSGAVSPLRKLIIPPHYGASTSHRAPPQNSLTTGLQFTVGRVGTTSNKRDLYDVLRPTTYAVHCTKNVVPRSKHQPLVNFRLPIHDVALYFCLSL